MSQFKDSKFKPDMSILDDVAKVAGGAVNVLSGLQQQIRQDVASRTEEFAARMDLVPREDLEIAEERISALCERIEKLEKRLDELDASSTTKKKTAKPKKKK